MRLGKRIQPWVNDVVARSSLIGNHPFYEPLDFPWIAELEPHWVEIKQEADEIRVVLLIQFRRPVGWLGKLVGGLFLWAVKHSRFVQEGRRGLREWTA